jgi:hypothetical protein
VTFQTKGELKMNTLDHDSLAGFETADPEVGLVRVNHPVFGSRWLYLQRKRIAKWADQWTRRVRKSKLSLQIANGGQALTAFEVALFEIAHIAPKFADDPPLLALPYDSNQQDHLDYEIMKLAGAFLFANGVSHVDMCGDTVTAGGNQSRPVPDLAA